MAGAADTIYSISTGALPSGVAVIRISGPNAREIGTDLGGAALEPRKAHLRTIRDRNGAFIDSGLMLYFPAPASFTGEDCLELQIHGGRAVVTRALSAIAAYPETRQAEAGEFTRRAFENGKMDLVEVEGLADLLAAQTEMQRRLASEQSRGGLSRLYNGWAHRLTHARAMIEAELDFADEDDVPGSVATSIWQDMDRLRTEIRAHLAGAQAAEIIRDGLKVVIVGPPNVGKSSLLNLLARRDVAIVTEIAGTTRDVLHVDLDLGGYAVRLYDTAGMRETDDPVEREGIRRAAEAAEDADLVLSLIDSSSPTQPASLPSPARPIIHIANKVDLGGSVPDGYLPLSTDTGTGLDEVLSAISAHLETVAGMQSQSLPSRLRHVELLREALAFLDEACMGQDKGLDLRAEDLRLSATALGRITGSVDVEALLDVIFSQFCIGK